MTRARLTIDLDALAHNHAVLRADAHGAEVAPVVKADGYGLGVGPIARRLWAEGARRFFVARLEEALALREALAARAATIHVLDGLASGEAEPMKAAGLTPVLNSPREAAAWGSAGGGACAVHVDTGMHRIGFTAEEAADLAASPPPALRVELVMSHLGSAAEPADRRNALQLSRFRPLRALFPQARASLAASAGIYLGPDFTYDLVRPGVSLYGGGPHERPDPRLRAVATLTAPLLAVHTVAAGETIGYGPAVTATRDMRLGLVGAGYADGVLRAAWRGGYAFVGGRRAPLVIVTMDLIGVDLTDLPEPSPGDRVELLGAHVQLDDVAEAAGSVAHEILTRLSRRAERVYVGEAA